MATEKFCLRWNDFESNISGAFRELRDDKDFFDVTLACDDDQIQAHKVILAACSPFFRTVLRRNPHAHPLLYLKGVKFSDLQAVLGFMYHGEVNVAQEELNSFLAVAEELRVKGLTQNQAPSSAQPSHSKSTAPPFKPRPPESPHRNRPTTKAPVEEEVQEVTPVVKSEVVAAADYEGMLEEENYQEEEYGEQYLEGSQGYTLGGHQEESKGVTTYQGIKEPQDLDQFLAKDAATNKYICSICHVFSHRGRTNVRNHIESRHFLGCFSYTCTTCGKTLNTRRALEVHKSAKACFPS